MSFSFDPQKRSAGTAGALGLALVVEEVAVPRCCPCELGSAVGARSLGRLARFLTLVPEEVAEGRELAAVAAVLPALGLGATLNDANLAGIRRAAHYGGNRVHHARVGHYGSTGPPGNVSYKQLRERGEGRREWHVRRIVSSEVGAGRVGRVLAHVGGLGVREQAVLAGEWWRERRQVLRRAHVGGLGEERDARRGGRVDGHACGSRGEISEGHRWRVDRRAAVRSPGPDVDLGVAADLVPLPLELARLRTEDATRRAGGDGSTADAGRRRHAGVRGGVRMEIMAEEGALGSHN